MAVVDPYSPCPCGSGQKFRWCCQKVEPVAEKAQRLFDNGQNEAALAALDAGLEKAPGNPWLTIRKAAFLLRKEQFDQAEPVLEALVRAHPDHIYAQVLFVRVVLMRRGPLVAIEQLQDALSASTPERRSGLVPAAQMIGIVLARMGAIPAARKHLELAIELQEGEQADAQVMHYLQMLDANPVHPVWVRQDYELSPPPEGLSAEARDQFEQALGWAGEGLWAQAAASFQALAFDGPPEADRNLGLCRLWMADHTGAVEALQRFIARAGATEDAVDLESLCQIFTPPNDRVDHVHQIWSLRDRDLLLKALRESDRARDEGTEQLDPDKPEGSFAVEAFSVLDRPKPTGPLTGDIEQVPLIVGRALVGKELAILEAYDDGRLEGLTNWFVGVAGPSIPPAHPKTKERGKASRSALAMTRLFWFPEGTRRETKDDLLRQARVRLATEVWPQTPMPLFGGRTPLEAGQAGDAEVPLRAAFCQLELSHEFLRMGIDFPALRRQVNVPDEPAIDPETVSVDYLHLARLHRLPFARLDDNRLLVAFLRAHQAALSLAIERAASEIITRPQIFEQDPAGYLLVYTDLAHMALDRGAKAEAYDWLERGRSADPTGRTNNKVHWELAELRLQTRSEPPETWVPNLAVILERYGSDEGASQALLNGLVEMGLLQLAPNPDNPEEMLVDSRPLQQLMAKYGPRVRTAAGTLGAATTKGGIWTPGEVPSGTTSKGGIWTPGSSTSPEGEGKKLILPG